MWSLIRVRVTTRAAMFWHFWSLATGSSGSPARRALIVQVQVRRNECMGNHLARVAVKECPGFANISDMVADRLTERVYMENHGHVHVSNTAPKSPIAVAGAINDSPTVRPGMAILDNCCRDPISNTSVLPSFSFRKLPRIQVQMSWQHSSSLSMAPSTSAWKGFTNTYNWESSAKRC